MGLSFGEALKSVAKFFKPKSSPRSDSILSSLHCKIAFGFLTVSCILSGYYVWFAPIECTISDNSALVPKYVNQICYANSTYIVVDKNDAGISNLGNENSRKTVRLSYYQWVSLSLFLQAACFQIPRILWKYLEGGRAENLINKLKPLTEVPAGEREQEIQVVADEFVRSMDRLSLYYNNFSYCQSLYLVNSILQIVLVDQFLGNNFLSLIPNIFQSSLEEVGTRVFPKQVKCLLADVGVGGTPQMSDVNCALSMNVLNEKVYIIMWPLLWLTLTVGLFQFFFCILGLFVTSVRKSWLNILPVRSSKVTSFASESLLLKFVRENIDHSLFMEFLTECETVLAETDPVPTSRA